MPRILRNVALLVVLGACSARPQDVFGGPGFGAINVSSPGLYKPGTLDSLGIRMPYAAVGRRQQGPAAVVDESAARMRAGLAATTLLVLGLGILTRLGSVRDPEQLDPPRATLYVVKVAP